jgi:glucosamine-6-phosphate isomerase
MGFQAKTHQYGERGKTGERKFIRIMELKIFEDHEQQSAAAADMIIELVQSKPDAVLCLATGDSPRRTYELIVEKANASKVDFSKCSFIGLDEWVGISPENPGSCHWFLHHYLFGPLEIKEEQVFLFNAMTDDLEAECKKMNGIVQQKKIDLMLVGVGMNGHIGFNEPGTSNELLAHVSILDDTTLSVGKKYFNGSMDTNQGITLGLTHFLQSKKALMMANGTMKASIIQKTMEENTSTHIPSTLIRQHPNAILSIDNAASSALKNLSEKNLRQ